MANAADCDSATTSSILVGLPKLKPGSQEARQMTLTHPTQVRILPGLPTYGSIAQMEEQPSFKRSAEGSTPSGPTNTWRGGETG